MRQVRLLTFVYGGGTNSSLYIHPLTPNAFTNTVASAATCEVPAAGVLSNLAVRLLTAPTSGRTVTIRFRKSGSATALSVTVSDDDTTGANTSDTVSLAQGDTFVLERIGSGFPVGSVVQLSYDWEPTDEETSIYGFGGAADTLGATVRDGLLDGGLNWDGSADEAATLIALGGTVTHWRIVLSSAPGTSNSRTFTIVKNGVSQDGTGGTPDTRITFGATDTVGSASFSLTLAPWDLVYVQHSQTGSPSTAHRACGSVSMISSDLRRWHVGMQARNQYHATDTVYNRISGGLEAWSATESERELIAGVTPFFLGGMIARLGVAPGTGVTFTLRKSAGNTTQAVAISGVATTGGTTGDIAGFDSQADRLSVQSVPSPTATVSGSVPKVSWWGTDVAPNQPPEVSAGNDRTIILPNDETSVTEIMTGSASDDGLPNPPGVLTIQWTQVSGPALVTFVDDTDPTTEVTFHTYGTYVLRLCADDGEYEICDSVTIIVRAELATPCQGGGVIAESTDPEDGPDLAPATLPIPWIVCRFPDEDDRSYAFEPLNDPADYYAGQKSGRIVSIGSIKRSASDDFGGFITTRVDVVLMDHDREFRTLEQADNFRFSLVEVYLADDSDRLMQETARRVGQFVIADYEPLTDLTFKLSLVDFMGSELSAFMADKLASFGRFSRRQFPDLPDDLVDQPVPGYYGHVSDETEGEDGEPTEMYPRNHTDPGWIENSVRCAIGSIPNAQSLWFAVTRILGGVESGIGIIFHRKGSDCHPSDPWGARIVFDDLAHDLIRIYFADSPSFHPFFAPSVGSFARYIDLGPGDYTVSPLGPDLLEYTIENLSEGEDYIALVAAATPVQLEGDGGVPARFVGYNPANGRAIFHVSKGTVRIQSVFGSNQADPPLRVRLHPSIMGSVLYVPGHTGWPYATLYREFGTGDDAEWHTVFEGDPEHPIVIAAIEGKVPFACNICGLMEHSHGLDDVDAPSPTIDLLPYQWAHFLNNFVLPATPWTKGPWLPIQTIGDSNVPWFNRVALEAAVDKGYDLVPTGPTGAWGLGVTGSDLRLDEFMRMAALNGGWKYSINEHGQVCIHLLDAGLAPVAAFDDLTAIPRGYAMRGADLINRMIWHLKRKYVEPVTIVTPPEGERLPPKTAVTSQWFSGELAAQSDESIAANRGVVKEERRDFEMHRHGGYPSAIIMRTFELQGRPRHRYSVTTDLRGYDVRIGQTITGTSFAAPSGGHVSPRLLAVESVELTLPDCFVTLAGIDITGLRL